MRWGAACFYGKPFGGAGHWQSAPLCVHNAPRAHGKMMEKRCQFGKEYLADTAIALVDP
jgi:hypothetical protein